MTVISIKFEGLNEKLEKIPSVGRCFKCSVCSSCPVTQFVEKYRTRKENQKDVTFVYDIIASETPESNEHLWKCCICERCVEVCPQDFTPGEYFLRIKEKSFDEGKAPDSIYGLFKAILENGIAFPVSARTMKDREKLGLEPIAEKPTEEIKTIMEKTGLISRLK